MNVDSKNNFSQIKKLCIILALVKKIKTARNILIQKSSITLCPSVY
jgi:hypothetical protein